MRAATPEELPRTIAWHPGGGSFVAHRADSRTPDPGAAETAYLYAQGAEQPVELVPKHAGSSVTWRPREPIVFLHSGYGTGRFMSCPCSLRRMTSMPSDSDPQARETGDGEGWGFIVCVAHLRETKNMFGIRRVARRSPRPRYDGPMARVAERSKVALEDYLVWERQQPGKHEYFFGEVFAIAGGSPRHNRLCIRVGSALENALGKKCSVFSADQRLRLGQRRYAYPDAVVVCGAPIVEHDDVITNPTVVVEVLSASTEQYDRDLKWEGYRTRESLTDYVLVSQDRARIEHFGRKDATSDWTYTSAKAGQVVTLTGGTKLDVDAIFDSVFELKGDALPVIVEP